MDTKGFKSQLAVSAAPNHNLSYGQKPERRTAILPISGHNGPTSRPGLDNFQNCERIQPDTGGVEGRGVLPIFPVLIFPKNCCPLAYIFSRRGKRAGGPFGCHTPGTAGCQSPQARLSRLSGFASLQYLGHQWVRHQNIPKSCSAAKRPHIRFYRCARSLAAGFA